MLNVSKVKDFRSLFNSQSSSDHRFVGDSEFQHPQPVSERRTTDTATSATASTWMRKLLDPLRDDLAVFAVLTGLRHKQSVHLRIDQGSPDCSRLYFDRRDTKNGMPLEIELSDDARDIIKKRLQHVDALQSRLPRLRGKIEYVFVQENGRPLAKWLNHHVRAKLDGNGFKGIRFHDLRHTFATWLRRRGVNSRIIQ